MQIFDEIKSRGVQEVGFMCMDGLSGLEDGAKAIFPNVVVQRCIVHLIRNSLKYVPTKDYKIFCADLKKIYGAPSLKAAQFEFERFCEKWKKYPALSPFGNEIFLTSKNFLIIRRQSEKLCTRQTPSRLSIQVSAKSPSAVLFLPTTLFSKFFIYVLRSFIANGQIVPLQIELWSEINFYLMSAWLNFLLNSIAKIFYLHKTIDTTLLRLAFFIASILPCFNKIFYLAHCPHQNHYIKKYFLANKKISTAVEI